MDNYGVAYGDYLNYFSKENTTIVHSVIIRRGDHWSPDKRAGSARPYIVVRNLFYKLKFVGKNDTEHK